MTPEKLASLRARRRRAGSAALQWPAAEETGVTARRRVRLPTPFDCDGGWAASVALEQIRCLAVHVLARCIERDLRTIAVTSALAGEGKTSVALALASQLARSGRRVLLVDLDLHRRTLSQRLDLVDVPGAAEAVSRMDIPSVAVYESDCPGLSVLPAGNGEDHILSRAALERLCRRAGDAVDIVLLDCPPLLPVAEAYTIGDVADRTVLVVRAAQTPFNVLETALAAFATEKILSAVLNGAVPAHVPHFRRVYGYYEHPDGVEPA